MPGRNEEKNKINDFLRKEITKFAKDNSKTMVYFLELTMINLTFLGMMNKNFNTRIDKDILTQIRLHNIKCLELATDMSEISEAEIELVVAKSIELVDCAQAIVDPKHTNLH